MSTREVELDDRRRLQLAKVLNNPKPHQRYRVTYLDYGEILLTPIVSVTLAERVAGKVRTPAPEGENDE